MSNSSHRSLTPQTQHMSARLSRSTHSAYGLTSGFAPSASFPGESSGSASSGSTVKPANPFVTNPHGHPSFNPIKLGSKSGGDSKTPKQPKPPDKPLMPYMRYSRKVSRLVWDSVKANNPDLKLWEIGKIIGQMWRELSDEEKQQYIDEYETEKIQYMEAMKVYHNSQAYQSWIAAKGKVDVDTEQEEPEKARRSKVPPPQPVEQRVIPIQPTEEEDEFDDSLSVKHIAAIRYQRNHCLINEIFSDAVVPDVRTIINETRMTVLKRQVHSLTMHQKKLEGELQQIEDKHQTKKCKFSESSEQFYAELRNLCDNKPQISDEQFNLMILKAKEDQKDKQRTLLQKETESQNHLNEKSKVEVRMVTEENLSEKSELTAVSANAPPPNIDQPSENNTALKIMEMDVEETIDERIIPTNAELSALELESEPQNSAEQQQQALQESSSNPELVLPSISEAVHEENMESEIPVSKDSEVAIEMGNGNNVEVLEKFSVVETTSQIVEEAVSATVEESSQPDQTATEETASETPEDVDGKSTTDEQMEVTPVEPDAKVPEIPEFKPECKNEVDGAGEQEINEATVANQNEGQTEDKSLEPEKPDEPLLHCESESLPESFAVVASQTAVMASESDSLLSEISVTEPPLSDSGAPMASSTDTGENKTPATEQIDSDREMPELDAIETL